MTRRALEDWKPLDGGEDFDPEGRGLEGQLRLDYNRGVQVCEHNSGLQVAMYLDAPGEYYHLDGSPASEEEAQFVGFDIYALRRQRRTIEVRQRASEAVAQLAEAQEQEQEAEAGEKADKLAELRAKAEAAAKHYLELQAKARAQADSPKLAQMEYEERHARG